MSTIQMVKPIFKAEEYPEFVAIPNYNDYIINMLGDVISFKRNTPKILKYKLDKDGYKRVNLISIDGKEKSPPIHRLIAITYIPNPENKPQINHINGIKTDNSIHNLEWCTSKENTEHAVKTKLRVANFGESHGISKLNDTKVLEIRNKYIPKKIYIAKTL